MRCSVNKSCSKSSRRCVCVCACACVCVCSDKARQNDPPTPLCNLTTAPTTLDDFHFLVCIFHGEKRFLFTPAQRGEGAGNHYQNINLYYTCIYVCLSKCLCVFLFHVVQLPPHIVTCSSTPS